MDILRAISDMGNVNMTVAHGNLPQILLAGRLAAGGKLSRGAARRSLGTLSAGVGIDFSIEHQNIDVAAGSQHMIQATEADIVSPAVAADDPHTLLRQIFGNACQLPRFGSVDAGQHFLKLFDALALGENAGLA